MALSWEFKRCLHVCSLVCVWVLILTWVRAYHLRTYPEPHQTRSALISLLCGFLGADEYSDKAIPCGSFIYVPVECFT